MNKAPNKTRRGAGPVLLQWLAGCGMLCLAAFFVLLLVYCSGASSLKRDLTGRCQKELGAIASWLDRQFMGLGAMAEAMAQEPGPAGEEPVRWLQTWADAGICFTGVVIGGQQGASFRVDDGGTVRRVSGAGDPPYPALNPAGSLRLLRREGGPLGVGVVCDIENKKAGQGRTHVLVYADLSLLSGGLGLVEGNALGLRVGQETVYLTGDGLAAAAPDGSAYPLRLEAGSALPGVGYAYYVNGAAWGNLGKISNRTLLLSGLVGLLFCAGVVLYTLYRVYRPVRRFMRQVEGQYAGLRGEYADEFDFIQGVLTHAVGEKESLAIEVDKNTPAVQELLISKMLMGDVAPPRLQWLAGDQDILPLKFPSFVFIGTIPADYGNLFFRPGNRRDNFYLLQTIVRNMMGELSGGDGALYSVTIGHVYYSVLCGGEGLYERVLAGIYKLPGILREKFGAGVYIAVCAGDSIFRFSEYYAKLNETLAYCRLYETGCASFERDYRPIPSGPVGGTQAARVGRHFRNAVSAGEIQTAQALLGELFSLHFGLGRPVKETRLNMQLIASLFRASLSDFQSSHPRAAPGEEAMLRSLLQAESVPGLRRCIQANLRELQALAEGPGVRKEERLKDDIISYIEENYADYQLTVGSVADHFNMTISTLSKFFKKQMEMNVIDYIHQVKIRNAKHLLEDHSVAEVAKLVSYNSSSSFIRSFKRYEGISPGKFMKAGHAGPH